jgi:hypothetical protein
MDPVKTTSRPITRETHEAAMRVNDQGFFKIYDELRAKGKGKLAVMNDGELQAVFDTDKEAYTWAQETFGRGFWSLHKFADGPWPHEPPKFCLVKR